MARRAYRESNDQLNNRQLNNDQLKRWSGLLPVLTLLACPIAWAQNTSQDGGTYRFDIPAQALMLALRDFTAVTGRQVVVSAGDVSRYNSNAVSGAFTPEEALTRLAEDTGLVVEEIDGQSYRLGVSDQPAPGSPNRSRVVEEVVVFGSRIIADDGITSGIPIRDFPQSVQVIDDELIAVQQARSLDEVIANSPSATTGGGAFAIFPSFQYRMRGFPAEVFRDGQRQRFAIDAGIGALANIDQVQVLKGGSAANLGPGASAGSLGGIVNLVTKAPEPDFAASATLIGAFGAEQSYGGAIDVTGPIGLADGLNFRLVGDFERLDTFIDTFDIARQSVHGSLSYAPGGRFRARFSGEFFDRDQQIELPLPVEAIADETIEVETFLGEPALPERETQSLLLTGRTEYDLAETWTAAAQLRYTTFDTEGRGDVQFRGLDPDDPNLARRRVNQSEENDEEFSALLTIDGEFSTGPLTHALRAGFEYSRFEGTFDSFRGDLAPIDIFEPIYGAVPGPLSPSFTGFFQEIEIVGIYLQDQVALSERLKLLLGGRYDYVTEFSDFDFGLLADTDLNAFSPRAGVTYDVSEWLTIFLGYTEGFEPQFVSADGAGEAFDPLMSRQFEGGIKIALGSALAATASVFDILQTNGLVTDVNDPDGAQIAVGEQTSSGVEFELAWRPTPDWRLVLGYAYIDAEVSEDAPELVGNMLPNVADHSASFFSEYTVPSGPLAGISLNAQARYVGERAGDLENSFTLPDYVTIDFGAAYSWDNLRIRASVENVADERFFTFAGRGGVFAGTPRAARVTLSTRF